MRQQVTLIRPGIGDSSERSKYNYSGLVDIGRRQNWLFSLRLLASPQELVSKIEKLLNKAQHS